MARKSAAPPSAEQVARVTSTQAPADSATPDLASSPDLTKRRLRALRGPAAVASVVIAATGYIVVANPDQPGHFPLCPLKAMTGLDCPMCGGLRSVNALAHGDVVGALNQNLFAVLCYPVLIWLWVRWTRMSWQSAGTSPADPATPSSRVVPSWWNRYLGYGILVALIVFTVARNLPFIPFLRSGLG